ncbi:hypothetical protein A0H81_06583 [Grifola frondosa]|uniref:Uncharacterized protein n=1 Tax=Grifola frondosa TaxID=5627 RepID=A0A1C7MCW3_GRIFR|nr:hypothetical protein A0H81_06583 [Grifola frondosa]
MAPNLSSPVYKEFEIRWWTEFDILFRIMCAMNIKKQQYRIPSVLLSAICEAQDAWKEKRVKTLQSVHAEDPRINCHPWVKAISKDIPAHEGHQFLGEDSEDWVPAPLLNTGMGNTASMNPGPAAKKRVHEHYTENNSPKKPRNANVNDGEMEADTFMQEPDHVIQLQPQRRQMMQDVYIQSLASKKSTARKERTVSMSEDKSASFKPTSTKPKPHEPLFLPSDSDSPTPLNMKPSWMLEKQVHAQEAHLARGEKLPSRNVDLEKLLLIAWDQQEDERLSNYVNTEEAGAHDGQPGKAGGRSRSKSTPINQDIPVRGTSKVGNLEADESSVLSVGIVDPKTGRIYPAKRRKTAIPRIWQTGGIMNDSDATSDSDVYTELVPPSPVANPSPPGTTRSTDNQQVIRPPSHWNTNSINIWNEFRDETQKIAQLTNTILLPEVLTLGGHDKALPQAGIETGAKASLEQLAAYNDAVEAITQALSRKL